VGFAEYRQATAELEVYWTRILRKRRMVLDLTEYSRVQQKEKFEGKLSEITGAIIGAFFQVHKESGYGFSEKVYENSLISGTFRKYRVIRVR
jgi:hypothetical protein